MNHRPTILFLFAVLALLGGLLWCLRPGKTPPGESASLTAPSPIPPPPPAPPAAQTPASSPPKPLIIPPSIRLLTDPNANYEQRLNVAPTLRAGLDHNGKMALYDFLRARNTEDDKQKGHVLKNRILDVLCDQQPPWEGLADLLIAIYRDRNQHVVLRDYAIQHTVPLYERLARAAETRASATEQTPSPGGAGRLPAAPLGAAAQAGGESERVSRNARDPAAEMHRLREILWEALVEADSSIAGTALLGLRQLAAKLSAFDTGQISTVALRLAEAESTGELTRITALQVCSHLQLREALPLLSSLAENGPSIVLRLSAIGSLGSLGGEAEIPLLRRILSQDADRLKPAATLALQQINRRLSETSRQDQMEPKEPRK